MCSFQSQLLTMAEVSTMEKILNNPGFQHLAEIIFGNLDRDHIDVCEQSNQYQISYHDEEVVKILAPLTDNLAYTDPNYYGRTPINRAAMSGHTEIVKILAPLTDNPNAPDRFGKTPIYWAALKGHTEIVKILAPLTNNPNAPNESGRTPSSFTQRAEIRRILESYNNSRKRNYIMIDYPQEQAPIQETIIKHFHDSTFAVFFRFKFFVKMRFVNRNKALILQLLRTFRYNGKQMIRP